MNKYFTEASHHCIWNPEDNKEDYKIELDEQKFRHVVKRFLKEKHPKQYDAIEKSFGDTCDKALAFDKMPGINQIALLRGDISPEDFANLYTKELDQRGKYPFFSDEGKTFVDTSVAALADLYKESQKDYVAPSEATEAFIKLTPISGKGSQTAVDSLLKDSGNPSFNEIVSAMNSMAELAHDSKTQIDEATKQSEAARKELAEAQDKLKELVASSLTQVQEFSLPADGEIPEGHMVEKKASELFPEVNLPTDFTLTAWEWEGVHPDVPPVDPHYIFRPKELGRVLLALVTNRRAYLHGHTGSGKTTLIEQVAARLNWPFARINFDSEITRMDLIGRDTLAYDGDRQVSQFVDGILPRVMSGPYITCFDELDFARPDVAYVMQAALEGNSLRITEDGDRIVTPHPYFRMFGTGNTVGQGDEHGMYAGARVQSLAFMNRFSIFCKVDYLDRNQREELIKRHQPALSSPMRKQLLQYVDEHLAAFEQGDVLLPISPRGMLSAALTAVLMDDLKEALEITFLDGASEDDRQTLVGIIDRVA